jgi:hypothetical protein
MLGMCLPAIACVAAVLRVDSCSEVFDVYLTTEVCLLRF